MDLEPKEYTLGFRISQEAVDDMFRVRPEEPMTLRRRIRNLWGEVKWRVRHAYDAIVHGDCDHFD